MTEIKELVVSNIVLTGNDFVCEIRLWNGTVKKIEIAKKIDLTFRKMFWLEIMAS